MCSVPSPLSNEILDTRHDRFIALVKHYGDAAIDDRAGRDGEGRYAFLCRKEVGFWSFTRVSSLKRAEVAAIDAMVGGWTPECVFDLDTMAGPEGNRWPVRHDVATTRTIVIFNTVPTPVERWA